MSRPDQLRRWAAAREKRGLSAHLLRDAADEIERLRAQVRESQGVACTMSTDTDERTQ